MGVIASLLFHGEMATFVEEGVVLMDPLAKFCNQEPLGQGRAGTGMIPGETLGEVTLTDNLQGRVASGLLHSDWCVHIVICMTACPRILSVQIAIPGAG
jgi:hypothetical protein